MVQVLDIGHLHRINCNPVLKKRKTSHTNEHFKRLHNLAVRANVFESTKRRNRFWPAARYGHDGGEGADAKGADAPMAIFLYTKHRNGTKLNVYQ